MRALRWQPGKPCLSFSADPAVSTCDDFAMFLDSSMKTSQFSVLTRILLTAGQLNRSLFLASQMCRELLRETAALKRKLRIPCLRMSGLATLGLDFFLLLFLDLNEVTLLSLQVVSDEHFGLWAGEPPRTFLSLISA